MDNLEAAKLVLDNLEGIIERREVAKLVLVEASVSLLELEGTMDNREVVELMFDEARVSLLAAARDLLQFFPGFADKPGD